MTLTREEIVKALRLCAYKTANYEECRSGQCDCPFSKTVIDCTERLNLSAADLITSLTAELAEKDKITAAFKQPTQNIQDYICPVCGTTKQPNKYSDIEADLMIMTARAEKAEAELAQAVECINTAENRFKIIAEASEYIKPNSGVWHTVHIALDEIKEWRGITQKEGCK